MAIQYKADYKRYTVKSDKRDENGIGVLDFNSISGSITGLLNYAYLPGRAGGQTLIGGSNASENLILQSTSNATRGYIGLNDKLRLIYSSTRYIEKSVDSTGSLTINSVGSSNGIYHSLNGSVINYMTSSGFGIGITPFYTLHLYTADSSCQMGLASGLVAHGMTGIAPTTIYGLHQMISNDGGYQITGFSDDDISAMKINGIIGSVSPSAHRPAIMLNGSKKNGTINQALSSTESILQIYNYGTSLINFLGNGYIGIGTGSIAPVTAAEIYNTSSSVGLTLTCATDTNTADPYISLRYGATPAQVWRLGADHTDGSFRVESGAGAALGANNNFILTTSGCGLGITPVSTLTIPNTTSTTVGVITKGANRFIHAYIDPTSTSGNVFIGEGSGNFTMARGAGATYLTSGNVGVGSGTLAALTTGYYNMAIGSEALSKATTALGCVGVGFAALKENLIGNNNVAVGAQALQNNTADHNLAFGAQCLITNTTGTNNVGVGSLCLYTNNGSRNMGIGYGVMYYNSSGSDNIGIGYLANRYMGFGAAVANGNIAIGTEALENNISGDYNIAIGYKAGFYETNSNRLWIDNAQRASLADGITKALIYGVFGAAVANQFLAFNAGLVTIPSGTICIGATAAISTEKLLVAGNALLSSATSPALYITDTTTPCTLRIYCDDTHAYVGTTTDHNVYLQSNSTTYFYLSSRGLVAQNGATVAIAYQNDAPASPVDGALWVDADASTNGDLMVYTNSAWRKVISLP